MNALLEQFVLEARDSLQGIAEKLMALEEAPDSAELMVELFRLVHTLKGNSGLFEFPEMTRVLHAGEDLMDSVRNGQVAYSRELADRLLDAMDFVGLLMDEVEATEAIGPGHAETSNGLAQGLRALIPAADIAEAIPLADPAPPLAAEASALAHIPEAARIAAWREAAAGSALFWINYHPDDESFFKGEDPFHQVRQIPRVIWGAAVARAPWPRLADLDCYRCQTDFQLLVATARAELDELFRYTPEQVSIQTVEPLALVVPQGHPNGGPVYGDFVAEALQLLAADDVDGLQAAARSLLELSSPALWLASDLRWLLAIIETAPDRREILRLLIESLNTLTQPDWNGLSMAAAAAEHVPAPAPEVEPPVFADEDRARCHAILAAQAEILALADTADWLPGRLKAVAKTLSACLAYQGECVDEVEEALAAALSAGSAGPLRAWLAAQEGSTPAPAPAKLAPEQRNGAAASIPSAAQIIEETLTADARESGGPGAGEGPKFGRRADDAQVGKILKVDQAKVDLLMNLIGEMVVAKNSLPYLANRAENQFGVRELSREIKAEYAVINRIAEEMQDAIMQVRMTPISFVLQRFPRLVRDTSRKLGKEVELVLEGEDTEADKNVVEALADPLVHIVRNSLDHGLEMPDEREAAGKPRAGKLTIRAAQESDRVLITISDDGRGIDPSVIKRKAYEKGIIDDATLHRLTDQEAINLVFAAGFSTAEAVSDLSGRGVGMDVVRGAIDRVGGTVGLTSEVGKGTTLRLSLPLSMAVTNVMIIEANAQIFGIPMDMVVETVRLPRAGISRIKQKKTTVLRDRIVPLVALNDLLGVQAESVANADDELAALVVRIGGEPIGLLVDEFREVVDVILKPLPGEFAKLGCYAGTALLGDGSVLLVLNPKELF